MRIGTLVLAVILLILAGNSAYVVNEYEQVIITQFGKPIGRPIETPGLKFKLPLVQIVQRFEKRFMEWDGDSNQIPRRDAQFHRQPRPGGTDPLLEPDARSGR
ncbi:MAG: membrane protease subunit HflC [bacterium]|nr:MAG: membrane protease subunit HflC [bacterium]